MKHKTTKLLSILLSFVMVAGLLPLGQVAYAYSEGDIPGTTGTGTASDPIMVDNFTELRAACGLATFGTDLYIKFEGTTVEETLPFDAPSLTNAISLNTGYVHLILDGSYVFKVNKLGESQYGGLFEVRSGGFLEISGNGKLSFSPMLTGADNAVILVNGGTVEVNSGRLDGHPLNWAVWGRAISYRTGKLTINGGTFTGYNDQSEPDRVDAIAITPPSSVGENYVRINGGSFSASSKNTPTKGCFGLSVWGTSTFNKYEVIKLAGGIFDGIDVDVEEAKIGDILEEGYHTYYANSGNAAPGIEALKTSTEKIKIDKSTYTVTFHANGHGTAPVAQTVDNGKTATKPTDPTETGWIFGGWYKEATCTNAFDFSTPITGDITLFAKWTEAYTVTVNNDGNGTASASPTSGPDGTLVTLTATPNPGYKFKEWIRQEGMLSGGLDVPNATSATTTFTISGYKVVVKATFEEDASSTAPIITTSSLPNGKVGTAYNQPLAATGTPTITWTLEGGTMPTGLSLGTDGKISGTPTTAGTYTFTVKATNGAGNATKSFTVTIAPADATTYPITVSVGANGTASASATSAAAGTSVTITATPNSGYEVNKITYTPEGESAKDITSTKSFTMPAKKVTVNVSFKSTGGSGGGGGGGITTQYTLTYNTNGGSTIAATKHNTNTVVNLTATPIKEGFTFDGWYSEASLTNKITSIKIDGNKTVYAGWKENTNPNTGAHDCPSAHLKDVDTNAWYHEGVDYVVAKKLMQGIAADQFAPNATTTRAMIVTILYRLEGEPVVSGKSGFEDVEADTWYTKAVAWAEANDIVNGYSGNKFGPMDPITREQMAAIMFRYSKFKGYDTSKTADLSVFTDNGAVSDWAVPAMKWAVAEELFKGVDDNLISPTTSATRAQVATILMRYIENVK